MERSYRIPKRSLDLLLWATRTRQDLSLREYTGEEIAEFIDSDQLDDEARKISERFMQAADQRTRRLSQP